MARGLVADSLRFIDGVSLAALRTLVTRGSERAREVIGLTLVSAHNSAGPVHTISPFDLVRAFAVDEPVVVRGGSWFDGSTCPLERYMLAHLTRFFRPRTVVEIGTFRGTSTALLLDNLTEDATVYTVDLPVSATGADVLAATDIRLIAQRDLRGSEYRAHARRGQVVEVRGSTMDEATWTGVPTGIDFAFIDASHSYDAVRNDTERLWPKLSPSGVVVWHDYTNSVSAERGVGKYIRELMRTHDDVFICAKTTLAMRIPVPVLASGAARVPGFFPENDYEVRHPGGAAPWLKGAFGGHRDKSQRPE